MAEQQQQQKHTKDDNKQRLQSTIVDSSVDYFVSIRCFVYKNVKEMKLSNTLFCPPTQRYSIHCHCQVKNQKIFTMTKLERAHFYFPLQTDQSTVRIVGS